MFGKLTRVRADWRPDKLVCKRFNVPDPYFGRAAAAKTGKGSAVAMANAKSSVFAASTAAASGFEELLLSVAPAPALPAKPAAGQAPDGAGGGGAGGDGEQGEKGGGNGKGAKLLSLVASDAPVTTRPPADVFKSIFDDSDDDDDDDLPPAYVPAGAPPAGQASGSTAPGAGAAASAGATGAEGGDSSVASLDGMLSFFASKTASSQGDASSEAHASADAQKAARTRKSRWDTGVEGKADAPPVYAALPPPAHPPAAERSAGVPGSGAGAGRGRGAGRGVALTEPAWKLRQQQQPPPLPPPPLREEMSLPSPSLFTGAQAPAALAGAAGGGGAGGAEVGPFGAAAARRPPKVLGSRLHEEEEEEELRPYEEEAEEEEEPVHGNRNTMAMLEAAGAEHSDAAHSADAPAPAANGGFGSREGGRGEGSLGTGLHAAIAQSVGLDLEAMGEKSGGGKGSVDTVGGVEGVSSGVVFKAEEAAAAVPYKVLDLGAMRKV